MKKYLGIDIGGTKIAYGLFDESGALTLRREYPSDINAGVEALFSPIFKGLQEEGVDFNSVTGVGIGAPSAIDYSAMRIISTVNLPLLADVPLREVFREQFPFAYICAENDANAAALAEKRRGAGRDFTDMVYVSVSTGVGGGIILNGDILHGRNGYAGEIGHMLIRPGAGPLCGCGQRGCFESLCGGKYIGDRAVRYHETIFKGDTLMLELTGGDLSRSTGHTLYAAYKAGDKMASEMFHCMCDNLGLLAYNLFRALDVDGFVFGGGLMEPDWPLLENIRAAFNGYSREGFSAELRAAELGEDVGVIGAYEALFTAKGRLKSAPVKTRVYHTFPAERLTTI